jgi:hypothetical protein
MAGGFIGDEPPGTNSGKKGQVVPQAMGGSETAKKTSALILEVLAGLRSPAEGSEALGFSSVRYYLMERRALAGMVQTLEPRPKERYRLEETLVRLTREKTRLEQELGRMQALVRAAQRTVGVPPAPSREKKKGQPHRKRPVIRALKTVELLRSPVAETSTANEAKSLEVP